MNAIERSKLINQFPTSTIQKKKTGSLLPSFTKKTAQLIQNKQVTPITKKKPENPLELSPEEIALFRSGILQVALPILAQLTGGYSQILSIYLSPYIFGNFIPTGNTNLTRTLLATAYAATVALSPKEINPTTNEPIYKTTQEKITSFFTSFAGNFLAPAPVRTLLQAHMSYKQATQAFKGIHTCIKQIGKSDTLVIGQNLFIHTVNIATAFFNLTRSLDITRREMPYYQGLALRAMGTPADEVNEMLKNNQVNLLTQKNAPISEIQRSIRTGGSCPAYLGIPEEKASLYTCDPPSRSTYEPPLENTSSMDPKDHFYGYLTPEQVNQKLVLNNFNCQLVPKTITPPHWFGKMIYDNFILARGAVTVMEIAGSVFSTVLAPSPLCGKPFFS